MYPAPRAAALQAAAPATGLAVTRVRFVRSRPGYAPRQVLFELQPQPAGAGPLPVRSEPVIDPHDETGLHAGPVADFFRRIERLAAARESSARPLHLGA
ncbi:MAG: hypothetical protein M5U09_18810 [Gammaproteobacteria bacterium]|nr:hypothetical protein [Gammaproteobacteria bacterium]